MWQNVNLENPLYSQGIGVTLEHLHLIQGNPRREMFDGLCCANCRRCV